MQTEDLEKEKLHSMQTEKRKKKKEKKNNFIQTAENQNNVMETPTCLCSHYI